MNAAIAIVTTCAWPAVLLFAVFMFRPTSQRRLAKQRAARVAALRAEIVTRWRAEFGDEHATWCPVRHQRLVCTCHIGSTS